MEEAKQGKSETGVRLRHGVFQQPDPLPHTHLVPILCRDGHVAHGIKRAKPGCRQGGAHG